MSQRGRGWQAWRAVLVSVAAAAALIMIVAHWVTEADEHRISLLSYAGLFLIGVLILVDGAVTGLIAGQAISR